MEEYIKIYGIKKPVARRGSKIRDSDILSYGGYTGSNQDEAAALAEIKYYLDAYGVDRKGRKMDRGSCNDGGKHSSKVKRRSKLKRKRSKKKSRKSPIKRSAKRKAKRKVKRKVKSKRKKSRRKSRS